LIYRRFYQAVHAISWLPVRSFKKHALQKVYFTILQRFLKNLISSKYRKMKVFTSIIRVSLFIGVFFSLALNSYANPVQKQSAVTSALEVGPSGHAMVNVADVVAGTEEAEEAASSLRGWINWTLLIIVILLFVIIGAVFDILQKVGEINGKSVIDWNNINSKLLLGFLIVGMGAAVWEFIVHAPLTVHAQEPASEHGAMFESMFMITLVLTGIVFVITQILLFWYGYKYKFNKNRRGLYYPDNHRLEFIWTIIPAIVLTVLVIRGLMTWNQIMYSKDEKSAMNIEIYGYQFGWNVRYSGADNKLGAHNFRLAGVMNSLGVDTNDSKSFDDIVANELHLPVGKPVHIHLRAKDVIHSAYLPHFRAQMNVVPGLPTKMVFTPTITTSEMRNKLQKPEFDYILLCNKICGSAHYRMKMKVVVDSPADYEKWLKSQPVLVASKATQPAPTASEAESNKEVALNK
jgi:cytochrome c oxidase subunit 2